MIPNDFHSAYFDTRECGQAVVLKFRVEHLNDEDNIEEIGNQLLMLVEKSGCQQLVIDLSEVRHVTSSFLAKLITLHRRMHRQERLLIVCGFTVAVKDVFETSGLMSYLRCAANVEEALTMI